MLTSSLPCQELCRGSVYLQWSINRINFWLICFCFLLQLFRFLCKRFMKFKQNPTNSISQPSDRLTRCGKTPPDVSSDLFVQTNLFIGFYTQITPKTQDVDFLHCLFYFQKNSGESIHLQNLCQSHDQWNRGPPGVWALNRAVFISLSICLSLGLFSDTNGPILTNFGHVQSLLCSAIWKTTLFCGGIL